ncbi:EutN/CcmL family microcompartment protein [bacterium]|nr:EutN/CcmL family microcompartment protein [bacterium]
MRLGKVIGELWATRKQEDLSGFKLLIVRDMEPDGTELKGYTVAADTVDAGVGEVVLMVSGSATRQTDATGLIPSDTVIVARVDKITMG